MKKIVAAKEAFKKAEGEYYRAAKRWGKVQAKALAEIADLERRISNLQDELSAFNPYVNQEESKQHWDEIPHAIHSLQVEVEKIKAQLNA